MIYYYYGLKAILSFGIGDQIYIQNFLLTLTVIHISTAGIENKMFLLQKNIPVLWKILKISNNFKIFNKKKLMNKLQIVLRNSRI